MNPALRQARTVPDAELLTAIAGGDLGGLGVLFDRYQPEVKRFVGRLGVAEVDVDDLVQLTFLDLPRAAAAFDGRGASARSWLLGVAAMVVRRHRRSLARITRNLVGWAREPVVVESPSSAEHFELHEAAARAKQALERLSSKKREVFVLVVLENASGLEAAQALGIPVATVWTRLHHARHELRKFLEEEPS